jgi:branched-chain amino acid transport system permease protein
MKSPKALQALIIVVIFVISVGLPFFIRGQYWLHIFIMAGIAILLSSSLRFIYNMGQMSLGHAGMMTIGAYAAALLAKNAGWSTWLALVAAIALTTVFALLVAFPFMRLRGMYFTLITVFMGEVIRLVVEQWRTVTGGNIGISNLAGPDPIRLGSLTIAFGSKASFYWLTIAAVWVVLGGLYSIECSRVGRSLISISQAEKLAESVGINCIGYKIVAFTIGCGCAGLAGGLYAQYNTVITPAAFGFVFAVYVLIYMIVGGPKRFLGPIIGALVLTFVPEWLRFVKQYQPFFFVAVVMVVITCMPEGLIGLPRRTVEAVRKGVHRVRG